MLTKPAFWLLNVVVNKATKYGPRNAVIFPDSPYIPNILD